jgi:predicted nuclease of predicted toxin-antitoxin system
MKLLFDQNLSPRLSRSLADIYPDSVHVRDLGLSEATDTAVWAHAQQHSFVIVSKDSDFQQRSLLLGHPPKVIWLRVGNGPTRIIEDLLRKRCAAIRAFERSAAESYLILP